MKTPALRPWIAALSVFVLAMASYAQWSNPAGDVPAYHPHAPLNVRALPKILSGAQLTGPNFRYHWQVHAYQDAAKIGSVLYQLPCYCRCDRELGHTSLRSCYEGLHATECDVCAKEGLYAYQKTMQGWTPARIRAGIERRDYDSINLDKE